MVLGADTTVDTDAGGTDGNLDVSGTIDGAQTLGITAGGGSVNLVGAVGSGTALTGFDVVSANNLNLAGVRTQGTAVADTINLGSGSNITGTITLTGDLDTTGGGAVASGGIRIAADNAVELEANGALAGTTDDSNQWGMRRLPGGIGPSGPDPGLPIQDVAPWRENSS